MMMTPGTATRTLIALVPAVSSLLTRRAIEALVLGV